MADDERTTEQKIASGRPEWTPFALLGSVFGVIAVLVAVVVAWRRWPTSSPSFARDGDAPE